MKSAVVVLVGVVIAVASVGVKADSVGCKRAGGVKCQYIKPKHTYGQRSHKIIVVPKHHRHYHAFHHPLVTALGIAIILDAAGNPVTDTGNKVVVLGDGTTVTNVYEQDDTVYLIKGDK